MTRQRVERPKCLAKLLVGQPIQLRERRLRRICSPSLLRREQVGVGEQRHAHEQWHQADEVDRLVVTHRGLREASTPRPIPFPWKRAWPGLAAGAIALVVAVVAGFVLFGGSVIPEHPDRWTPALGSLLEAGARAGIDLAALALVLTFGTLAVTMRLASRNARVQQESRKRASC